MKPIVTRQNQQLVDNASSSAGAVIVPPDGWLRTLRQAIGMSGAQLARYLGVSRAQIAQAEKNEVSGAITLNTMQKMAAAMGGRLVYAVIPAQGTAASIVSRQARMLAEQWVRSASAQMGLENQSLNAAQLQFEIERLQHELERDMPKELWEKHEG